MLCQHFPDVFGKIGHQVKAVSLTQIDPLQNLVGAIGGDILLGQPGDQLLTGKFDDIRTGNECLFRHLSASEVYARQNFDIQQ